MRPQARLLRQIHPGFVQSGRVTSQAFHPTPKDENHLSVDNGDLIDAQQAYERFTRNPQCRSAGVLAVLRAECDAQGLPVVEDGLPYPEHCSIDFSALSAGERKRKAKHLAHAAQQRGWLYSP